MADVKEPNSIDAVEAIEFHKPNDNDVEFEENTVEEKKLVRRIDMYLMPSVWVLYLFSYMDRTK